MSVFRLDGIAIKNPSGFEIEEYTLTKSTRVANGDMVMDFVANKQKFNFTYAAITSKDLDVIRQILWLSLPTTRQCFHTLSYLDNEVEKTARVYAGAIPRKLHNANTKNWVWKDVSFSLIQK